MRLALAGIAVALLAARPAPAAADDDPPPEASGHEPESEPQSQPEPVPESDVTDLESAADTLPEFEEVVVTTDRPYVTPLPWVAGRSTIGPEEVRQSGTATLGEVLRRRPGFHMADEGDSDSKPNFAVRGLSPQRSANLTMLLDGVPLALGPYAHPGQSLFPVTMERVHAVEMIRGGGSVRYGPNNVAGVINFLTRPIPAESMVEETFRVGSNSLWSAYTAFGGTYGEFGLLFEDVHKGGDTFRENGTYRIDNQGIKAAWRPSEQFRVLVQYDSFDDDSENSGGMNDAYYESGDLHESLTPVDEFDGSQDRFNVRVVWEPERDEKFEILAFGFGGERTFHLGQPQYFYGLEPDGSTDGLPTAIRHNERRATVWGVQALHTGPVRALPFRNALTLGARYQDELFFDRPTRTPYPTGSGPEEILANRKYDYHVTTVFAEHELSPLPRLTVTPGVRLEVVEIDALDRLTEDTEARDFSETLPAVGASYLLEENWSVYGSWAATYRPPGYAQISFTDNTQEIVSEHATTWEAGSRGAFLDGALRPEVTYFFIDFRDRFEPNPQNDDVIDNIGRQENRGVETYVEGDLGRVAGFLDGFGVHAGYTHLHVRLKSGDLDGNHGPGAPEDLWSWGLGWHSPIGLRAGIDGVYVSESFSDAENTEIPSPDGIRGINPSYSMWSARVGWDGKFLDGRARAGLEFGVTNLLDEQTFDRNGNKGLVPLPERALYLQASVSLDF